MAKYHLWRLIVAVALAVALATQGVSAAPMVFQSPPFEPPPNNDFANATLIPSLPFTGSSDTEFATLEVDEPQGPNYMSRTVWYKFDASTTTPIRFSAAGSTFNDNNFNVYLATGPGFSDLYLMGSASYGASFAMTVTVGTTYYIQAGYISSLYGYIQLSVQEPSTLSNDNFYSATAIPSLPFSDSVDLTYASTEYNEPQPCNWAQKTVWYAYTPAENQTVKVTLSGAYDTSLVIYQAYGPNITNLSEISCTAWNFPLALTFNASGGTTYYFQVGSIYGYGGTVQVTVEPVLPPANDNFADAAMISGTNFYQSIDVTGATTQSGEPTGNCSVPQHTVWYAYTPLNNGAVSVSLWGSNGDAVLNAYRADGNGLGGLSSSLGCANNGYFNLTVQANETYYFQAGTMWPSGGNLSFSMSFIPAPANDNFTNATTISALPYSGEGADMTAASREANEPTPSCSTGYSNKTVWYAYTPSDSGALSQQTYLQGAWFSTEVAVYTGSSLTMLQEVACRNRSASDPSLMTFHVNAGTTYYFQMATNENTWLPFNLQVAPPPVANFGYYPYDASIFDTVYFNDWSSDPAGVGIQSWNWIFGDGGTATGQYANHRYTADGDYTVQDTVTTYDGRIASTSQTIHVKTHDVTIAKFTVPQSAKAGQTRQVAVGISNKHYDEDVEVQLYKSYPGYGWQWVGTLRQSVPVRPGNRTTDFSFNYTFTAEDAMMGKVTFRAVATIVNARDSLPADNEAISLPTKVNR